MQIRNTLTRKKETFKPIKNEKILMYHCGPTVYWTQHIGNMRAMVLADLIVRTFKYLNYNIKLVRNYTDVGHLTSDTDEGEDKMEKASRRENLSPEKIAKKYIDEFERDTQALNILPPDKTPRASECVKDIIKMVKILLDKGYAYTTDLAIYFDISKAKDYTQLSKQNLDELISHAGKGEVTDYNKKNPGDFAIWFFKAGKHKHALQYWKSPFKSSLVQNGEGFPGWHMECSVMANKFLAPTIDIHMGGVEHIPIHHTNEIAQSESANGVKFVNYWLHNEHLSVNGGKMSKSAGTSYTLQDIIQKGYHPLALRYFFLGAHYRSKQNFTWQALNGAQIALQRLHNFLENKPQAEGKISADTKTLSQEYNRKFIEFISDDFNIPQALALVWDLIKDDRLDYKTKKNLILDFDKVLGLNLKQPLKEKEITIPKEIIELAKQRETARKNKDWDEADALRNEIEAKGFTVEDSNEGFIISKL